METTTATLPKHVLKLALKIYRRMTEHYAAYELECAADLRNGHRPSHCEHGTYLWTDYDPICGQCEDGYSLRDKLPRWQHAKQAATTRHAEAKAMLAWAHDARKHGMDSDEFFRATLVRYEQMMEV